MPDTPTETTTTTTTPTEAPVNFGAEIAAAMAERGHQTRGFDPEASRAGFETENASQVTTVIAGDGDDFPEPPGGWPNRPGIREDGGGTAVDSIQQLAPPTAADAAVEAPPAPGVDGHQDAETAAGVASDPPAPAADELPPPTTPIGGYVWDDTSPDGAPVTQRFSDDEVRQGLQLRAWATQLTDETRNVFGAIEQGQAVAIPRAEFDRYQAWLQQQNKQQRDRDLENYDDEAAAEIARLRDQVAQSTPPSAPAVPNVDQNLTATANAFDTAAATWRDTHHLTEDEFRAVFQSALDAQIIPSIAQSLAQFNPVTGQLIAPADPAAVARRALDAALAWNPALHSAALTRGNVSTPTSPSPTVTTPAPNASAADTHVIAAKRAKAGSVASAPSAAAPPPRPKQLSGQEMVDAMAQDLARVMADN